ncbi:hypothetical protein B0H14DRAFT_3726987 [Mycena olivaceomarginata]|nr:hypothetical protein B0H14DRAFT_3726987 [Mycena olivaceomarginata]
MSTAGSPEHAVPPYPTVRLRYDSSSASPASPSPFSALAAENVCSLVGYAFHDIPSYTLLLPASALLPRYGHIPQAPTRSSPFGDLALLALPGRCPLLDASYGRRCETSLPPSTRTATIGDTPSLLSLRHPYLSSAWTLRPLPKRRLPYTPQRPPRPSAAIIVDTLFSFMSPPVPPPHPDDATAAPRRPAFTPLACYTPMLRLRVFWLILTHSRPVRLPPQRTYSVPSPAPDLTRMGLGSGSSPVLRPVYISPTTVTQPASRPLPTPLSSASPSFSSGVPCKLSPVHALFSAVFA